MDGFLAQLALLRTLPAAERKRLGNVCELRRFRKGQTIFKEGEPAQSVWLIHRGWVYLIKRTSQGIPATIFTVTPEELLCGFSAVAGQGAYFASAVTATDTTAIKVPGTAFSRLFKDHPAFALAVLGIYHARMRRMAEAISLAQAPVEQRLAYTLLRLRSSFGRTIPVTHRELAGMAGTRWETSIRRLSAMKRQGWLASSRGRVTVLAPEKLRSLLRNER